MFGVGCKVRLFHSKRNACSAFFCTFAPTMKEYHHITLSNGIRIIHEPCPTDVVYCGLIVNAGTRDELPEDSGMAHFCEHTTFKGTTRRRACHVRNCLERVGGDLNAYTNKEETVFYAMVQREDFKRAMDLLTDIVFHSIYPQHELEKEVEVIIDEIDCYRDSPAELIYDEFEEMLFRGHGLGRNILGKAERLRQYGTEDALRFTRRYYCPSNVTVFVYGNVSFDVVVRTVDRLTQNLPEGDAHQEIQPLPMYVPEVREQYRDTHQAHVLIGNRGYSASHPKRTALFLLNNILGGPGMNSLLNVSLREKNGLVDMVESSAFSYTDSGVWSVYFGCEEGHVDRCRKLVLKLLNQLKEKRFSPMQLQAAQKQLIGQILIAGDNFESYALALGKTYAHQGKHRDVNQIISNIREVTADDLRDVAQDLFDEASLTTLIYK